MELSGGVGSRSQVRCRGDSVIRSGELIDAEAGHKRAAGRLGQVGRHMSTYPNRSVHRS
jgi:hypothetical protein